MEKIKIMKNIEFEKKQKIFLILILFFYLIYCVNFIFKTSKVIDGKRYFVLFDDAMISMKYAKNFAEGYGLKWNKYEKPVEGYTNFLWTLYMTIPHFFKIDLSKTSLFIQLSACIFLLLNGYIIFMISKKIFIDGKYILYIPLILTVTYLPLNYWSLFGMEVSLLTLLINVIIFIFIYYIENEKNILLLFIYLLLGLLILIRIDMIIYMIFFLCFNLFYDRKSFKNHIFLFIFTLIIFLGTQTVFRVFYYNDILPNTYYLKMTGYPILLRILRGLYWLIYNLYRSNLILFIIPFLIFFLNINDKRIYFLFFNFWIMCCYSVFVGGDAWEWWGGANRYYVIVIPSFFLVFVYTIKIIYDKLFIKRKIKNVLLILTFILSIILFNGFQGLDSIKMLILKKSALYVDDQNPTEALIIKEITNDKAILGIGPAGLVPYFSERDTIDFLGKNEFNR